MNVKTKHNIGDLVYPIRKNGYNKRIGCKTCTGSGRVRINDTKRTMSCPDCYGRGGNMEWQTEEWRVVHKSVSKVGKISFEIYRKEEEREDQKYYMLEATGIGSGSNWSEENLFKSSDKAKLECDKRNKEETKDLNPVFQRTEGGPKK